MICERCNKDNVIKSGFTRGKQRYKCKDCSRHFIKQKKRLHEDERLRVVSLCSHGMPMSVVAKMFFITTTTVARWVKWYKKHPTMRTLLSDDIDYIYAKMWLHYNRSEQLSWILKWQINRLEQSYETMQTLQ